MLFKELTHFSSKDFNNSLISFRFFQVVRRKKTCSGTGRPTSSQHRASFPMVRPQLSESKAAARLEQTLQSNMPYENGDNSSSERIDGINSNN